MNLDKLLRAAGEFEADPIATRRAYYQIEAEYRRRSQSVDDIFRWKEELAGLAEEECAHLLKRQGRGQATWWREDLRNPSPEVDDEERALRRAFLSHAAAVAVKARASERSQTFSSPTLRRRSDALAYTKCTVLKRPPPR
jgi:hypothetical protein